MAEHVHEEGAVGLQPRGDAGEQRRVVLHVLQHLHAHDAVEGAVHLQPVHIGGDHLDVREPPLGRAGLDERSLSPRVAHRGDAARRVALGHPQRERPPPAAEFEHVLPVVERGALARERQHGVLRRRQVAGARGEQARRVLEPRTQTQFEEGRRHLVVLLVGGVGADCHRCGGQAPAQFALPRAHGIGASAALPAQPRTHPRPDGTEQYGARDVVILSQPDVPRFHWGHTTRARRARLAVWDTAT